MRATSSILVYLHAVGLLSAFYTLYIPCLLQRGTDMKKSILNQWEEKEYFFLDGSKIL